MSPQITPQEVAEILIDKVTYYCDRVSGDSYYECIVNHQPEDLDIFVDSYIDEDLDKNLGNTDREFWESVKKEYGKLWTENLAINLANDLSDILEEGRINIVENDDLTDDEKAFLLEKYKNLLDELGDAIVKALDGQKPLSSDKLREYLFKVYDITRLRYEHFVDTVDYYMEYYDLLDKAGKLQALSGFLDGIDDVLYDLDNNLKELKKNTIQY